MAGPLWVRGPGETPVHPPHRWLAPGPIAEAPRVRLLMLEGASLGFIRQRIAAGQLSNLARLLDHGAVMDLATIWPTQVGPVWVAAATGKLAEQNGVRANATYRVTDADVDVVDVLPDYCLAQALVTEGFVRAVNGTSTALQARTLWDILADYGLTAGVVNWPLTYPAHATLGSYLLYCEGDPELLFTENETNDERIYGTPNRSPYVKDGIVNCVIGGRTDLVNPEHVGTKVSAHYRVSVPAGGEVVLRCAAPVAGGGGCGCPACGRGVGPWVAAAGRVVPALRRWRPWRRRRRTRRCRRTRACARRP